MTHLRAVPPASVQESFDQVQGALSEKTKLETEALIYADRVAQQGAAEQRRTRLDAAIARRRLVARARSDAAALQALGRGFTGDRAGLRETLRQRRQDRMQALLERADVTILPAGSKTRLRIGPEPAATREETVK